MHPRTKQEMDDVMRRLARDCVELAIQGDLGQKGLASLLGTTRLTVGKWYRHMEADESWTTLPVSGSSPALLFMNMLIARRTLEMAIAAGELPPANSHRRSRWVRDHATSEVE